MSVKIKYQFDVVAVAQRALTGTRGTTSLSIIEIQALAQFVIWAEQYVPKIQMEKSDGNAN